MERRHLHFFRKIYPLFQGYPGFVLLLDFHRRVRFVNAYFRDRFGELGRVLGGKTVSGLKVRRRRKDGSRIDLSVFLAPVRDAEGKIRGCAAVLFKLAQNGPKARQRPLY
jgi:hypothetical protein